MFGTQKVFDARQQHATHHKMLCQALIDLSNIVLVF